VMCSKGDASAVCSNGSSRVIEVPEVADCLQPVVNIIPLQVCRLSLVGFFFFYICLLITLGEILLAEQILFMFGSVAGVPSDSSPWVRRGSTKESGEERDHTVVGRGGGRCVTCVSLF
jgi:hypothetical protein